MKIIFDIDGTLTDYRKFIEQNALPFFMKKYGMKAVSPQKVEIEDILNMHGYFQERFGCNEDEAIVKTKKALDGFWIGMEYVKYTLLQPFREDAGKLLRKLKKDGYKLEIHTSRAKTKESGIVGKIARGLTILQFVRNGVLLPWSAFHFYDSDTEKMGGILKKRPVCVFEDKKEIIEFLRENSVAVFYIDDLNNKKIIPCEKIQKVTTFNCDKIQTAIKQLIGVRENEYYQRIIMSKRFFYEISFCAPLLKYYFSPIVLHQENIKKKNEGILYVSNHRSTLDPVAITGLLKSNIHWAALKRFFDGKDSIFNNSKNPVLCKVTSLLFRKLEYFPIERKQDNKEANNFKAIKDMCYFLKLGEGVGIFPEGTTRRAEGEEFGNFDDSFIMLAKSSNAWIQPITVLWIEDLGIRHKVIINFGKMFRLEGNSNRDEIMQNFMKAQTNRLKENESVREKLKTGNGRKCRKKL
ncbi:MAG: 1-acyl-sn-glycerol-3-phosphate acyltransferase [Lachnospiraceae bacterium]